MKRGHLNDGYLERLLRGEHHFERHPNTMVYAALHALCLDSRFKQVVPHFHCQLGSIPVRPVILVDERLGVVEVVDKIMLLESVIPRYILGSSLQPSTDLDMSASFYVDYGSSCLLANAKVKTCR